MRHVAVDVLLTDLAVLGAAGGHELLAAARRGNPAIRVICVTGLPDATIDDAVTAACEHLLRKPYRAEQLSSEIRRLLPA
jgi:CheY-like chemotaxis protein